VIKREVIEGEKAESARGKVGKAAGKMLRSKKDKPEEASAAFAVGAGGFTSEPESV
jgi:hypothetical protein